MKRIMMKSKIHRATVTGTKLGYEGSISIDPVLLEAADILPGEQVHVLNVNTGARMVTYAILGERGSGEVMLNGPAARGAEAGDPVVVIAYGLLEDAPARCWQPRVVLVNADNSVARVKGA